MADKDPSDVPAVPIPPIVDLAGTGGEPDEQTVVKPRKKAAPKVVPPAVPPADVTPVEAAPAAPKPEQSNPYAQPNPYAAAPAAPAAQPTPYAQPNPYAAPGAAPGAPQPYSYGPYVPQPPKGLSIASMILGIAGAFLSFCYGFGFLLGVAAVITGHMATKRQPYAKGYWMTGIITGYAAIGITLLWVIGLVVLVFATSPNY